MKTQQFSAISSKLDYKLQTPEERVALTNKITSESPSLSNKDLELLSDYIISALPKDEKKDRKILTDNRLVTVEKRETSYEGLVGKLENGEDGIYNMLSDNKNQILTPKVSITPEDCAAIADLRLLKEQIDIVAEAEKKATGRKKYLLKKQLIEMRQDQYIIKNAFKKPIYAFHTCKSQHNIDLAETVVIGADGSVNAHGVLSLLNPEHVSALLCNYSNIKQDCWDNFSSDMFYLMKDLDDLVTEVLEKDYPLYFDLLVAKIDGLQNIEIQKQLEETYGIKHSVEYISSLWRNKIPKMIAEKAQEDYLVWYYTNIERGKWKRCSRCGQVKLAHNRFFSKNSTSKDGFYSICKCCRNAKTKKS